MADNKNNNITGNKNVSSDFLRVLLALKDNVFRTMKVAEIAQVNQISGDFYRCSLINSADTNIECYKLKDLKIEKNDWVLVIFTDTNYRNNLSRIKKNQSPVNEDNYERHSQNFGVIVGIIYKEN